ncbi:MAG: ribonuclease P protein component [Verrucomicrobiota bacterium JB023]|nr:ribonuclease P protein component [Verrucomicrobiota bacterium JB023]
MKLPRRLTLNQRSDFQAVRESGQSASGRFLVLATREVPDLEEWRYAIITTRKAGKAHERNQIRRLVRSILVEEGEGLAKDRHYVFIARWQAKNASQADLKKDFLRVARKLKVLAEPNSGR